jgi:hypothetical protein
VATFILFSATFILLLFQSLTDISPEFEFISTQEAETSIFAHEFEILTLAPESISSAILISAPEFEIISCGSLFSVVQQEKRNKGKISNIINLIFTSRAIVLLCIKKILVYNKFFLVLI